MRAKRQTINPPVGVGQLLEVLDPANAFEGYAVAAEAVRVEREGLGISIDVAARFAKIPAPTLVEILTGRRAFRAQAAYDVLLDRIRSAARHRARNAAGIVTGKKRPGSWR